MNAPLPVHRPLHHVVRLVSFIALVASIAFSPVLPVLAVQRFNQLSFYPSTSAID